MLCKIVSHVTLRNKKADLDISENQEKQSIKRGTSFIGFENRDKVKSAHKGMCSVAENTEILTLHIPRHIEISVGFYEFDRILINSEVLGIESNCPRFISTV